MTIFNFELGADIQQWQVVNDGVMGGLSQGHFSLNEQGHGMFSGKVSVENNGGFSSIRCALDKLNIKGLEKFVIRLRGDGKSYQFRAKSNKGEYYSYIFTFPTTGEWEDIEISLDEMYPSFRGRKLNQPNFSAATLEEIGFLIGNKKAEDFQLLIDKIELR